MLVLVIVLAVVVVLALLIGFGGLGGGYGDGPTVYRRVIYRRPTRRVITEHRVVDPYVDDAVDPIDRPVRRP